MATRYNGRVRFAFLDGGEGDVVDYFRLTATPTSIIFRNGVEVDRYTGWYENNVTGMIDRNLRG
jgi:thioredoxin-like negative regulator of GroEL